MKSLFKLAVIVCRNTPEFRGKWRLEAWLERNRDKFADYGPVTYRVRGKRYDVDPRTNFHLYMYGPKKNLKIVPWMDKFARAGSVAIDVGAHSGYFTICLADAVGDSGKVYAFEASPMIYTELEQTIRINRLANVLAVNRAVSDIAGHIEFYVAPRWKSEISSMRPSEGEKVNIEATTLDTFIPDTADVSFVKIDVEGAEMKVLRGMEALIKRNHPVMVIEISDPWLRQLGSSSAEVFEFLHRHGYKIFEIQVKDCIEIKAAPSKQIDGLCIPTQGFTAHLQDWRDSPECMLGRPK
jgi:FkbM family methyltransferase